MKIILSIAFVLCLIKCNDINAPIVTTKLPASKNISTNFPGNSWQYFLQHLPVVKGAIVDYKGNLISNQEKHFAIINYDVGTSDLQQCADALIRLRTEYLFAQHQYDKIGFHFCSGDYYSWNMYCEGLKPAVNGNHVNFVSTNVLHNRSHTSLRNYLDIVYSYASTISLCKELKPTDSFTVGAVITWPGSPGHCCIIINETTDNNGEKLYKLAEGYMPAQSIYILSNPYEPQLNPWYHLNKNEVLTASCDFKNFYLKKFE